MPSSQIFNITPPLQGRLTGPNSPSKFPWLREGLNQSQSSTITTIPCPYKFHTMKDNLYFKKLLSIKYVKIVVPNLFLTPAAGFMEVKGEGWFLTLPRSCICTDEASLACPALFLIGHRPIPAHSPGVGPWGLLV